MRSLFDSFRFLSLAIYGALIFISTTAFAQLSNLKFESYNTSNGLSQNQVYCTAQDKAGFIWFGTDEGLNRFDGYEFKKFKHDRQNPNSLIDNSIHALVVDDAGILWIGTSSGLCRYYPDTEYIERLEVSYEDTLKPNGTGVKQITKDKQGNIWISYLGSGLDVYNRITRRYNHYSVRLKGDHHIENDYVVTTEFLNNGDVLLGTRGGIEVLSNGKALSHDEALRLYPWIDKIDKSLTNFQLCSSGNTLLISTELNGFYKVELATSTVKNYNTKTSKLLFNNNVPSVYEDSNGKIWIGGEAVYLFNEHTELLTAYNEFGRTSMITAKNPIISIFEDKDKNVWFGTFRLGVLKYSPDNIQIMHFTTLQSSNDLQNDPVLSFAQDRNKNIWIGTDGSGLYKLNKNFDGFTPALNSNKFNSQVIKCIYTDDDGVFWMGTWDGGMIRYNPSNGEVKSYSVERGNFASRHVWGITGDGAGNLWIGSLRDGLCHFSPTTGKFEYFKNTDDDATSIVNNDILSLLLDSEGTLWIGTSNGLSILKKDAKQFVSLKQKDYPNYNLNILSIYEDYKNRIWLGTNGGGIIILTKDLKIIKTITEKDGLPSSTVCAMQRDKNEILWVSSYNGLVKINSNDESITQIPKIAGLQNNEFIAKSSFRTTDGLLLFGGVNGFNLFNPDSLHFKQMPKPAVFTSLKILNTDITPSELYENRKIINKSITESPIVNLSYQDYAFTLTFSPLVFNWQEAIRYSFILEGFDKQWQYTSALKRFIHYTNLSPGKYVLKVKTSLDGVHWSTATNQLVIIISPPWWQTATFRLLVVGLFTLLLLLIYKIRVRFLSRQKQKLEQLVLIRTRELEDSNREIQLLLKEVDNQKQDIENKNHELLQINEELATQNETLEAKRSELHNAQERLQEINTNLEHLVDKRTRKLKETLMELETFLYRASHDLRGPISSMLGLVKVAELEIDSNHFSKQYLDFQQKSIVKLERTLQKLTQKYSILKSKVLPEEITEQTISDLLSEITLNLPTFRPQDFHLVMPEYIRFRSDRAMLGIILTNLMDNAFFFSSMAVNKTVTLEIIKKDGVVLITINDHGPGIKPTLKKKYSPCSSAATSFLQEMVLDFTL